MINICPNCKGIVGDNDIVCPKCGVNIIDAKEQKAKKPFTVTIKEDDEKENSASAAPPETPHRKNNKPNNQSKSSKPASEVKTKEKSRYPFTVIGVICIIIGCIFFLDASLTEIPDKEIDTYAILGLDGGDYTEYVGGDAYNLMIEASLRAGIIAGKTVQKAIYTVSGVVFFVAGIVLAMIEKKGTTPQSDK